MGLSRVLPRSLHRLSTLTIPMRRGAVTGVLVAATSALGAAVVVFTHVPDPAIQVDPSERTVTSVMPGGPAWNDGIRPGQVVVVLDPGEGPRDWQLMTSDGAGNVFASPATSHLEALRGATPVALLAALLAATAVATLVSAPSVSTAVAATAYVVASVPLSLSGEAALTTVVMATAPVAGAAWLLLWSTPSRRVALAAFVVAMAASSIWVAARFVVPAWHAPAELGRLCITAASTIAVLLFAVPWRKWVADLAFDSRRITDLAFLALVAGSLILAVTRFEVALWIATLVCISLLIGYAVVRGMVISVVDGVLFAHLRELASLEAVEDDRARLAADIHDVPLQELAAVIRRLEAKGGTREETEILRDVAAHLREVTTELRPPVLDDLGLGAAVAFVVDRSNNADGTPRVFYSVTDDTGIERARRPPADVEIAVFRIIQEALLNARQHASATTVSVEGSLSHDYIELAVVDDGVGMEPQEARDARRRGRLGIASMHQRASAINAGLDISRAEVGGTRVLIVWRRG